jgi:serine protease Do
MTAGIISARARSINNDGPYDDFLQTDASINRGNSGGPLFALDGHVIGINSAIYSPSGGSVGIGFAIPSNLARGVIAQIARYGKVRRGWIGVRLQQIEPGMGAALGMRGADGVLVASVLPNGPAHAARILPGDIILKVDGHAVSDPRRFLRVVGDEQLDHEAKLDIWRHNAHQIIQVKIAEAQEPKKPADADAGDDGGAAPAPPATVSVLGVKVAAPTPDLKNKYQLSDTAGAVVVGLAKGSGAEGKLQPGDVILELGQADVKSPADLVAKVTEARRAGHKTVLLLVDRGGDLRFVGLPLDLG